MWNVEVLLLNQGTFNGRHGLGVAFAEMVIETMTQEIPKPKSREKSRRSGGGGGRQRVKARKVPNKPENEADKAVSVRIYWIGNERTYGLGGGYSKEGVSYYLVVRNWSESHADWFTDSQGGVLSTPIKEREMVAVGTFSLVWGLYMVFSRVRCCVLSSLW